MPLTSTERSRLFRTRYPLIAAYKNLKRSAEKRRIVFDITLDEFEDLCHRHGYLELKGKGSEDMTWDRDDDNGGYTYENMLPKRMIENIQKQRFKEWMSEQAWKPFEFDILF